MSGMNKSYNKCTLGPNHWTWSLLVSPLLVLSLLVSSLLGASGLGLGGLGFKETRN